MVIYGYTEQVEASKRVCHAILKCSGLHGWQLGRTKVFLKCQQAEGLMAIINSKLHKIVIVQNGTTPYFIKSVHHCCFLIVIRGWRARRIVSGLRDQAAIQVVAMETMMESMVINNQWDKQCHLHKVDLMVTEEQFHLVVTMTRQVIKLTHLILVLQLVQVTASGIECCTFLYKLKEEDNKLHLTERSHIASFFSEVTLL